MKLLTKLAVLILAVLTFFTVVVVLKLTTWEQPATKERCVQLRGEAAEDCWIALGVEATGQTDDTGDDK